MSPATSMPRAFKVPFEEAMNNSVSKSYQLNYCVVSVVQTTPQLGSGQYCAFVWSTSVDLQRAFGQVEKN